MQQLCKETWVHKISTEINKVFTEKAKNMLDFDYVYKGVYLTRLISFLLFVYGSIIIYAYYSEQDILAGIFITTVFFIFIMICRKIGDALHWKSIW